MLKKDYDKPNVGDVFYIPSGKKHGNPTPVVVTRVGRKYFTVETRDRYSQTIEYVIATRCRKPCSFTTPRTPLIDDLESYFDEKEIKAIRGALLDAMGVRGYVNNTYDRVSIALSQWRALGYMLDLSWERPGKDFVPYVNEL